MAIYIRLNFYTLDLTVQLSAWQIEPRNGAEGTMKAQWPRFLYKIYESIAFSILNDSITWYFSLTVNAIIDISRICNICCIWLIQ